MYSATCMITGVYSFFGSLCLNSHSPQFEVRSDRSFHRSARVRLYPLPASAAWYAPLRSRPAIRARPKEVPQASRSSSTCLFTNVSIRR
jgi:hypothetical protein